MEDWREEMDLLYHLLDQEVANYRQLIDEIKKEAKYLRTGETEALIRSVQAIDERIKTIRSIEEQVRGAAETLLHRLGKDGKERPLSCLGSLLPPVHQSRLSAYQQTLSQLKQWAKQINDQTTTYIRDYMDFLSNLISPLVGRGNGLIGYPNHKPLTVSSSYALNQEV